MTRLISLSIAALSALTIGATAAQAQEARPVAHAPYPLAYDRAPPRFHRVEEWRFRRHRELERERARFYARWNGDRARRIAFERWYADQCARLRNRW